MAHFRIWNLIPAIIFAASVEAKSPVHPSSPESKLPERMYELTIDGTATMGGKWTCGGNAEVETQPSRIAESGSQLNVETQMVSVTAFVPEIECGDAKRNEYLRKALKMNDFPEISYRANRYTLIDNGRAVQSSGELTIAGVTRPVDLGAKLIALPEGGVRVVGELTVNLPDYHVKPPSRFFGVFRVGNTVLVRFDTVVHFPDEVRQSLFSNLPHLN